MPSRQSANRLAPGEVERLQRFAMRFGGSWGLLPMDSAERTTRESLRDVCDQRGEEQRAAIETPRFLHGAERER